MKKKNKILSFIVDINQIKNHKFPQQKQKQEISKKKTTNVNADGTVITIESLKDYHWDSK